jgi:hypothetical protein
MQKRCLKRDRACLTIANRERASMRRMHLLVLKEHSPKMRTFPENDPFSMRNEIVDNGDKIDHQTRSADIISRTTAKSEHISI